jgi:hypothetical protein
MKMRMLPCGGGVMYLHRSPVSRRRRRKGKSWIWDSKIWSWVPQDSDPRMTALARASSNYKRQTCPLVRESAPHQQTRNSLTVKKSGRKPLMCALFQDRLADWLSVVTWLWLWRWEWPCMSYRHRIFLHEDILGGDKHHGRVVSTFALCLGSPRFKSQPRDLPSPQVFSNLFSAPPTRCWDSTLN